METALLILGALGSIASLFGFFTSIIKKESLRNIVLYAFLFITIGVAVCCFQGYKRVTDEKLRMEERREAIRNEAKQIIDTAPYYISKYDPGKNEGIVMSTLVLLEKNKDLFPDTYDNFKKDVIRKLESSNTAKNDFNESEDLENAANASIQLLKHLSK